jgi:hypothetical protein
LSATSIKDIYESARRKISVLSNSEVSNNDEQLLEGIDQTTVPAQKPPFRLKDNLRDTLTLNDTI